MISVVIPAYNEGKNIGRVLESLKKIKNINEIIVVNDGSSDDTKEQVLKYNVKLINLNINTGKGNAVKIGIENASGDIIVLLDADLVGLTETHFNNLVYPVLNNKADMTVGIFSSGRTFTDLAQKVAPFLSGQRAIRKSVLGDLKKLEFTNFGVEIALNKLAKENNWKVENVLLENMTHIMKEEKLGFFKGFKARMKMYYDIIRMWI